MRGRFLGKPEGLGLEQAEYETLPLSMFHVEFWKTYDKRKRIEKMNVISPNPFLYVAITLFI